jgi:hypothetical protein
MRPKSQPRRRITPARPSRPKRRRNPAQPKAPSEDADEEDADSAGAEKDEEGKPKKPTRTSQLRAKVRGLTAEVEDLQRRLSEREADESRKPPKEEDFNGDFEAYNRALIAHETAELLRKERSADDKRNIEDRQREILRERMVDHDERVQEARKVIPDYDKVVKEGLSNINGNSKNLELLLESEKSELIAYHLAEKPERAREFARMHPYEAAKHIGKLEARLSLPKPKTQSEAPAPVPPLKGGATPAPDPSKMSMDEYARWRNAKAS